MESHQESTIVHILRAGVLLLALITVPGAAVCWNLFPKDFWNGKTSARIASTSTECDIVEKIEKDDPGDLNVNNSYHSLIDRDFTNPSLELPSYLETATAEMESAATPTEPPTVPLPRFDLPVSSANAGSIRTMGHHENDRTTELPIPTDFASNQAVWAVGAPKTGSPPEALLVQSDGPSLPQPAQSHRNFPAIERELKEMGAKYYRLEKWGSRGELFRFSCYVSPKGQHPYQKYFQTIDSDEIRVMERVVSDIRAWRETP